jgi:hypothetical protein
MRFEPYIGYRWQIPSGIKVNKSIHNKFKRFETCLPYTVMNKLKYLISFTDYKFNLLPFSTKLDNISGEQIKSWTPPLSVTEAIQSNILREVREWKFVKSIYLRLFKVIQFIKGLIYRWRLRKCLKNIKNTEDPVTMESPKSPVCVIDFPKRISYTFEASTLRKTIEGRIILSEYMFPNPLPPINPFTNEVFTRGQLISIISQCKKKGEFSWILDRLYANECDLNNFILQFRQPLKIMAIENHFKGHVSKFKDEVIDYFQVEADREELPDETVVLFCKRIKDRPTCYIVKEWINITRDYYIARELQDVQLLANVAIRSSNAIIKAYYSI